MHGPTNVKADIMLIVTSLC